MSAATTAQDGSPQAPPKGGDLFYDAATYEMVVRNPRKYSPMMRDSDRSLTSAEKLIWVFLCDLTGVGEMCHWPGVKLVGDLLGMNMTTVSRAVMSLCEKQLISLPSGLRLYTGHPIILQTVNRNSKQVKAFAPKPPDEGRTTGHVVALACASPQSMVQYLCWGKEVFEQGFNYANAKPSQTNWMNVPGYSETTPQFDHWTHGQFAGWYWAMVSQYRFGKQQQITLPSWGLLFRHIKALMGKMPPVATATFLHGLVIHFDVAAYILGPKFSFALDEMTPNNPIIVQQTTRVMQMSPEQRTEWVELSRPLWERQS